MAQIFYDSGINKAVIYASLNTQYDDMPDCPFCLGEGNVSKEVYKSHTTHSSSIDWTVKVFPEKKPISDFHEVVVHSSHDTLIHLLSDEDVMEIFKAFKDRYLYYSQLGQVHIFSDEGPNAGSKIKHVNSQIIVLPHKTQTGVLPRQNISNSIYALNGMTLFCPDFIQYPYEVHITSNKDFQRFGDLQESEMKELSLLFKQSVAVMEKIVKQDNLTTDFSYSFYIYPFENWFLRIFPRINTPLGFEMATDMSINMTEPLKVAKRFKEVMGISDNVTEIESDNTKSGISQNVKPEIFANSAKNTLINEEKPKTEAERINDVLGKLGSF